ncbi:MAG: low specificity L-threonine aldolase [Candidatus Kapabacteria bacterium]|nr:low specificity L-threonine aldolase [Candidatus Kapabacteria bacterium]
MIDLRSDTLTVPDEGMRQAMAQAVVGDDIYSEDPTINALQDRVAAMFGKEAALFVPSGTMGNQICLALHARTGDEIIADADAHIFHYENAAASVIARAQIHGIRTEDGSLPIHEVREAVRPPAYYYPRTSLVAVENTHNRHGGTVMSMERIAALRALCDELGLPLHCDGARIWNAAAATSTPYTDYGAMFDTMSVCLSKGLGAPVGSLILGRRAQIDEARRWRKMLGGGLRQSGVLAAAAMYALDTIEPHLRRDHEKAMLFAHKVSKHQRVELEAWRVQSNIVMFRVIGVDDHTFIRECVQRGLRIAPIKPGTMRAVFYHQVSMDDAAAAGDIVDDVLSSLP